MKRRWAGACLLFLLLCLCLPARGEGLEGALSAALDQLPLQSLQSAYDQAFPQGEGLRETLLRLARGEMALDGETLLRQMAGALLGALRGSLWRLIRLAAPAILCGVLEQLRSMGNTTPVLMLTALSSSSDQVKGLRAGADDYLAKPFDLDVFQARLDALVRRSRRDGESQENIRSFLDLTMNTDTRTARIGPGKVDLHGRQFDFLLYLVENKNVIVHKERLFQRIWGFYSSTEFSVVEVYASQIRKVLRQFGYDKYLKTVRGIGYILTDDSELYG